MFYCKSEGKKAAPAVACIIMVQQTYPTLQFLHMVCHIKNKANLVT